MPMRALFIGETLPFLTIKTPIEGKPLLTTPNDVAFLLLNLL